MGVFLGVSEGLQPLIGQSYGRKDADELRFYFRSGMAVNLLASLVIYVFLLVCGRYVYILFNSSPALLETIEAALPQFGWAFILVSLNLMIGSYLYSTKRTAQATVLMFCRCVALNSVLILFLPWLLGPKMTWYAAGLAELSGFFVAAALLKHSEKNGIVFR
jgi:Na+-driven multidrug efflux pump